MYEQKTKPTDTSVQAFLDKVEDKVKHQDALTIHQIMKKVSGKDAVLWGDSIIGYGEYEYRYASGRSGKWMKIGFSPRKQYLSLYILNYGDIDQDKDLLDKLGKYKHGKSCLYIKRLEDVDLDVLESLIKRSWERAFKAV